MVYLQYVQSLPLVQENRRHNYTIPDQEGLGLGIVVITTIPMDIVITIPDQVLLSQYLIRKG